MATHFSALDWVIVIGYLAATMATGLYGRKFVGGISDFLVAGRELGTFLAVATLAATEIGTITFMYYAELGYKTGYASFVNGLIAGLVMIFLGRTGFIVEQLRAMKLMTVPEFFQVKFSRNLRVFVGILVAVGGILNMGVFLRIEGTFLAIISGIPLSHIKAVMTGILLLELVYTVLGGMVSIVITDFIQFVALSIGTILVTIWSVHAAGVYQHVQRRAADHGRGRVQSVHEPRVRPGLHCVSSADLAGGAYLLADDGYAQLFDAQPRGQQARVLVGWLHLSGTRHDADDVGHCGAGDAWPESEFAGGYAAHAGDNSAVGRAGAGGGGHAGGNDVGEQLVSAGLERDHRAGHHRPLRRKPLTSRQQVMLNRGANLFVSLFVMVYGLWYTLPGPTYFYLNMTASIYLSGTLVAVVAGLFWSRASTLGGYLAMAGGAVATIGFFFFKTPASYAGAGRVRAGCDRDGGGSLAEGRKSEMLSS